MPLVLLQPRTDPEREAEAVARWPLGTSGFPLVAAVAQRLRLTLITADRVQAQGCAFHAIDADLIAG